MGRRSLLALLFLVLAAPSPAAAVEEESWSAQMADELMSPFCPGRTLRSCPSPDAGELVDWIATQEAAGREQGEVYEQLLAEFGEEIRQAPSASGFGAAAYAIPLLAVIAGGALLFVFLRNQNRPEESPEPSAAAPLAADPELERIIDEELERSA